MTEQKDKKARKKKEIKDNSPKKGLIAKLNSLDNHVKEYPVTEDQAFKVTDENEIPLAEAPAKLTGCPIDSAFTKIKDDLIAHEIPLLGCIVVVDGNPSFVPHAAIRDNGDGTFDLIRGRILK